MEQRTNIVPTCSPKPEKHSQLVRQKNRYVGKNKWKNIKADRMARQKLLFSLKVTGNFWNYLLCWKTWDLLNYLLYKVVSRLALSYFLGILGGKLSSPTVSSWLTWSTGGLLQLTDFPSTLSVTMPSIKSQMSFLEVTVGQLRTQCLATTCQKGSWPLFAVRIQAATKDNILTNSEVPRVSWD